MRNRHHVPRRMRAHLEAKRAELIAAVPPNMVEGLRWADEGCGRAMPSLRHYVPSGRA